MNKHVKGLRSSKICLVGPVAPPYRGGIAQHTTQLHAALVKYGDVYTVSFKRLYPGWLYPGKSDKLRGQEDERLPDVDYLVDVYWLLSLKKTADAIVANGCDVAILSWWTLIWQPGMAYLARRLRKQGIKVIFLCHNLFDHDAQGLKRWLAEVMLRQADAYLVHSTDEACRLEAIHPGAPVMRRQLLPIYENFPEPTQTLPKRGRLELLFFGFIRPYKGLDTLVEALASLADKRVYLTVVGEAWGDAEELQRRLLAYGAPNVDLILEYVDDARAADYFARADVVVLPYVSATGSGVLSVAYHYLRPVLATRVGGLSDGILQGKTGWLVEPNSPKELADAIGSIRREELKTMSKEIKSLCDLNTWDAMACDIYDFAKRL